MSGENLSESRITLSDRARARVFSQCAEEEKVCPWDEYLKNPFDEETREDGFVSLAYSENKLIWPYIKEFFEKPITQVESQYDYTFGGSHLREGMARLLRKTCSKQLSKQHLVGTNGALGVLENLLFSLFNPGDKIALLVPYYPQHRVVLTFRNELEVVDVHDFEKLLEAIAARKVAGVLWTNPSNPIGHVFDSHHVARLVAACSANRVHLISDEVYATCVFDSEMIGVLNFCKTPQDGDYVHVVTGLAKLGFSGAKLGFVYTENPALVKTLRAMSRLTPVATPSAVYATRVLCADEHVVSSLLAQNATLLRNQYFSVVVELDRARIPYLPSQGGLTMVLDLRVKRDEKLKSNFGSSDEKKKKKSACSKLAPGWAGEEKLFEKLVLTAKVHFAAGRDFGFSEPGFFRMTFAESLKSIRIAIKRLRALLDDLDVGLVTSRDSIVARYRKMWSRTDQVFGLLKEGSFLERPITLRHPFIFYLGHVAAFAWNQMVSFLPSTPQFDAELAQLFERGIDPDVDTGKVHSNSAGTNRSEWPSVERVRLFRDHVRARIPEMVLQILSLKSDKPDLKDGRIFELIYEHETMHQETLLYMFNCLDEKFFDPVAASALNIGPKASNDLVVSTSFAHIPANKHVVLGADAASQWGWDNEFPRVTKPVDAFAIRKTPITNAEFVPFIAAGGYSRREFWTDEDWDWIQREKITHPVHWIPNAESKSVCQQLDLRVIGKRIPLDGAVLDWPVQVSYAEASAWCKWRADGSRLPTEAEWYHAAYSESTDKGFVYRPFPWGSQAPTPFHGNFGFARFSPSGVMEYPESRNYWGLLDLLGNGWEWTSSPFSGFPGFAPILSTYPGYSADFFDGKHFVLRGGSFASVYEELRSSFRNWYQGRYPFVFSKFRPVRPVSNKYSVGAIERLEEASSAEQTAKEFAAHVIHGLSLPLPQLSSMYFYDDEGSKIYEEITRVEEYYLTNTEHKILHSCKGELAELCSDMQTMNLMEFGAGDGHKTQTLIDHFVSLDFDITYFPIDISEGALVTLTGNVKAPKICPIAANNLVGCAYVVSQTTAPTLALFLGSSLGNYDTPDAIRFLKSVYNQLRVGDMMLIGFDLRKDLQKLHAAYFDSQGVTSRFNINLLNRMNRELGANFNVKNWQHRAVWNGNVSAMESWLIPIVDQTVTLGPIGNNKSFKMNAWEGIRVERSYKYSLESIKEIARGSGFSIVKHFGVEHGYCVSLWKK